MEFYTLLGLFGCLLLLLLRYKASAIFHPGFWYLTLWISCVSALLIMMKYFQTVYFEEHYRELFFFVNWGAACFVVAAWLDTRPLPKRGTSFDWSINGFQRFFALFTVLSFVCTIFYWYTRTGFSLDVAAVRDDFVGELAEYRQVSIAGNIVSRIRMLNVVCALYCGVLLARWCSEAACRLTTKNVVLISLTLLNGVASALAVGGRRSIVGSLIYMAIGYTLGIIKLRSLLWHRVRLLVSACLVFMVAFGLFSTFVKRARDEFGGTYQYGVTDSAMLNRFEGLLDYLSNVFWGYQFKTEFDPLPRQTFGRNTFNGLCGFSVPLVQRLTGVPLSLGALVGYTPINKVENFTKDYPFKSSLASVYYEMRSDFGFVGTLVMTLVFVVATQYLYGWWIRRRDFSLISCYLLFEFYNYWGNCIFSGVFSAPTMVHILYMFIAVQLLVNYSKRSERLRQMPGAAGEQRALWRV